MGELLSLRGVGVGYAGGHRRVLVDVSLGLSRGEVGAVVASRFEGKTTLLRVAAGILSPDRGEVWLGSANLATCSGAERERLLGRDILWVSRTGPALDYKVRDYIALPLLGRDYGAREIRLRTSEALKRFGIAACARRRWDALSDGERLLVQFARVFAAKPRLLVVDDLLDGLAMSKMREVGDLLGLMADDLGCAVLMSTAGFESTVVADRVWLLGGGRLELLSDLVGTDAEIIDFPGGTRPAAHGARRR